MSNQNPTLDETITANASIIEAAVTDHLPNPEFDFEFILYERDRRRRRLRGMTSRLHKDWTSLDNERRSAACRFEWARLQIFLAAAVLPILRRQNDELYIVKLADPRWRFSPEELATSALFYPNREVHQGIYNLREMKFNPTWTPLKTSPFCGIHDSIRLCDLQGADDAGTAWVLGFGRTLSAVERGGRSAGEAQRDHPLACVRKAVGEGPEAV